MSDKISKTIFNPVNENVKALEKLFPDAVKDGQVDFEALRAELGAFEEAGHGVGNETYSFTWNGKAKAKAFVSQDIGGRTLKLKKGDGVDEDTTQNIYIEGDNLEALKLLRNSYYNRIKMIYIDPPYNTNNDFIYRDKFMMTDEEIRTMEEEAGNVDDEGNRLVKNSKDGARYHTNWLNMIYPRLKIARDLLTDDGVIFISIDDNEIDNLKKICNEIFGEQNFVSSMIWQKKTGASDASTIATITEYVVVYAKSILNISLTRNTQSYDIKRYKYSDEFESERGVYYIDNLDRGGLQYSDSLNYGIECPDGTITFPNGRTKFVNDGWIWKWSKSKIEWAIENKFLEFRKSPNKESGWSVCYKNYLNVDNENKPIERAAPHKNLIQDILNANAASTMKNLFGTNNYFNYSKPIELLKLLVSMVDCKDGGIVLDFFSGSGTIAHAVMQLNAEDGGNRKFIAVQLKEKICQKEDKDAFEFLSSISKSTNICEIGKERIRRAGAKIKVEAEKPKQQSMMDAQSQNETKPLDIGFKVFEVADTNIQLFRAEMAGEPLTFEAMGASAKGNQELLDFTIAFDKEDKDLNVVYELLIRHRGIPLSAKIEKLTNIGQRTYSIANTIVVCLEASLTKEMVSKLAQIEPEPKKYIFRDSAFSDDINLKTNTLNELTALIAKQSGGKKQKLKVEFI